MRFVMTIQSENQAVVDYPTTTLLNALAKVRDAIEYGLGGVDGGTFLDINGNSIGTWEVTP